MSTATLLSTINEKIVYKTQGNVAPYTEGKGNGISFSLSVSKRENVEGSLPLTPTRLETITILSPQAADGPDGSESLDRISSAKVYESGVSGNELLVSSNSLVKETRSIKVLNEELSFKAYTFGFPAAKQLVQGKTYTVELLLPDETTFVVDINTGVPNEGNLSRAAFIVTKVGDDYIASNAATPLIEITGSDDVLQHTPDGDGGATKTDPLDTNSLVYADNIRVEEAKRFIKNIRWRWDVVSERGNKPKNGFRPKMTMRRFAPGAPLNSIRIILDMITDAAPYINPIVSGDVIQGKWKPRVTWFRKDMQQQTYDLRADATVTIIQDLVPDYEDGEDELVNGGGNCSRIQEIEYVWDAAEVSTPPLPYPQGVTYDVQGINRDDESGLFNYMLVKSIAQEQHFGPYIASSSKKSYATREIYKNAYNLPADLPQEGDIVDGGKVTQVSIEVNADCTYDITIVKSYTTKASAVKACSQTIFEHVDSNTTSGNDKALDDAPTASNGVITSHTSRLEDDGTYTNEVRTSEELGVKDAVKQTTTGKFISTTTTADRNQKKEGSLGNGALGTVKNSKTEGGLYNVEKTTYSVSGGTEAESSKSNIFSSESTKRTVGTDTGEYPTVTATGSAFTVTETSCSVDSSTGAVTRAKSVTAEISVTDAVVVHSKSIYGVQTSRLDKNCANGCIYTDCAYKPEQCLSIGESVKVSMNPGGSADVETSKTTAEKAITIASSGVKTAHTEVTEYSEVKDKPFTCNLIPLTDECGKETGAYVVCDTVGKPDCGMVTKWSSCVTEVGTWRTTVTVDKELTVQTRCSSTTTAFATDASETCICNTQAVAMKSLGTGNAIVTVSSDLTQNDQYCNTTRTITPIPQVWDTVNNSPFNTITRKDFRNVSRTDDTVSQYVEKENCDGTVSFVPTDGAPKYFSTSRTMNEHELFDGCTTTVSAKEATRQAVITQDIDSAQVTVKGPTGDAFCETTDSFSKEVSWCFTTGNPKKAITTTSNAQDEFGMKEEQVTVEVPGDAAMDHITYHPTTGTVTEMFKFWNQACTKTVVDSIVNCESVAKALRTSVSVDFARNKFGLYNGSVVITGRTTSGGSGSNSDFESTWENLNVNCTVSRVFVPRNILNGVKQVIRTYSFIYDEGTTSTYAQAVDKAKGGHSLSIDGFEISTIAKDITLRGHQNKGGYFRKIKSIKLERDIEIKGMNNQDSLDYVVTTPVELMSSAKTTTTQG